MLQTAAYAWYQYYKALAKIEAGVATTGGMRTLAQLANMTSFSIPVNITDHAGPPKVLTDMSLGSIEGFVTE
jgi:hypothetical protein